MLEKHIASFLHCRSTFVTFCLQWFMRALRVLFFEMSITSHEVEWVKYICSWFLFTGKSSSDYKQAVPGRINFHSTTLFMQEYDNNKKTLVFYSSDLFLSNKLLHFFESFQNKSKKKEASPQNMPNKHGAKL